MKRLRSCGRSNRMTRHQQEIERSSNSSTQARCERASSATSVSEVDLKDQTATILRGKGGKTRIVPIGQYAAHYIGLYIRDARRRLLRGQRADPGNLFLSAIGTPLNRQTINRAVFDKINRRLEGDKRLTCYSFRHASATGLIANGVDIAYVAQLLGHESLETTKRYLKIEIGDLKEQHARYHPREQLSR